MVGKSTGNRHHFEKCVRTTDQFEVHKDEQYCVYFWQEWKIINPFHLRVLSRSNFTGKYVRLLNIQVYFFCAIKIIDKG